MTGHRVQLVAITFDDGSVGVMQFVLDPRVVGPDVVNLPGYDPETGLREATDEAIAHEIARSAWGERTPVSWRRLEPEHYPTDRTFRNAWHDPDGAGPIRVHLERAREIHRARLRDLRAPRLAALDVAYQRADEAGDAAAKAKIAARKQVLRDATAHPAIKAATTPEELAAAIPDALRD